MNNTDFEMRSYVFGELALLYSPNTSPTSANKKLHRWIKLNKRLNEKLHELGFYVGMRNLSPKMVELIVKEIGEP